MIARSRAILALTAVTSLPCCKPPSPRAPDAVVPIVTAAAPAPRTVDAAATAPLVVAPRSPESDAPYANVVSPSGLLNEAIRRAHDQLRAEATRFRVRAIDAEPGELQQEFIDLTSIAAHGPDESLRERCEQQPTEQDHLAIPARTAALRAYVLRTPAARRTRTSDPESFAELTRSFTDGIIEVTLGCTTPLGNALAIATVDDQHTVVLRKSHDRVSAITDTWLAQTTGLEGVYHVEDDRFRADFTGDSVNEAAVVLREYEGARRRVELFSADAARPATIELPKQECSATDCDGESGQLHCRQDSRPAVLAVWDTDRWLVRVGLDLRRLDANGTLSAARPRDAALAAWLDRVRSHELSLRALARALSRPSEQLAAHRSEITASLRALGEAQPDIDRALSRIEPATTRSP